MLQYRFCLDATWNIMTSSDPKIQMKRRLAEEGMPRCAEKEFFYPSKKN